MPANQLCRLLHTELQMALALLHHKIRHRVLRRKGPKDHNGGCWQQEQGMPVTGQWRRHG